MPTLARTDEEISACFDVIAELRTGLKRDEFLPLVHQMQETGYQLLFEKRAAEIVAVAGYRISSNLFMGKHLYVDDLVTAEKHRSKGFGEILIQWMRELAITENCNYFHLDSGTHRGSAHKFYFNQGLTIASYHFSEALTLIPEKEQ